MLVAGVLADAFAMNGSTINASSMNIRAPTSSPATAPAPQTVQAHEPREHYPEDGCTDYRNSTCPHGERVRFESWNSWSDGSLHLQEYGDRALMGTVSKDQYAKYVCEVYWDNGEIELHMVGTLCRLEYRITLEDIVFTVLVLVCECISFGGFLMHASECDNSTVFCFCINIVATVGLTVGKLFPPRTRYSNCISVRCQKLFHNAVCTFVSVPFDIFHLVLASSACQACFMVVKNISILAYFVYVWWSPSFLPEGRGFDQGVPRDYDHGQELLMVLVAFLLEVAVVGLEIRLTFRSD